MAHRLAHPLRRVARQFSPLSTSIGSSSTSCPPSSCPFSQIRPFTINRSGQNAPARSSAASTAVVPEAPLESPSPKATTRRATPPPPTPAEAATTARNTDNAPSLADPLPDAPSSGDNANKQIDWTSSYHGLGTSQFPPEVAAMLQSPIDPDDIEVKPDGIIYLPEIKYRRVLNAAFGPGGWGLAPRGDLVVQEKLVSRDYALVVQGRFVAQARGEQIYFSEDGISTASEGCKSNAMMRCCKDLGVASELWDPRFIRAFQKQNANQVWVEHATTKKRKQIWLRKDDEVRYPFKKV